MENFNPTSGSKETTTPTAEPEKKDTKTSKSKSSSESIFGPSDKQKVERDLGKTVELSALFSRPKEDVEKPAKEVKDEQSVAVKASEEAAPEVLNDDETLYVRQVIAHDHLEAIRSQSDTEARDALQPAEDFLERVSDGQDPERAASEVSAAIMDELEPAATADDEVGSVAPEADNDQQDLTGPTPAATANQAPETGPPTAGGGIRGGGRPPLPPIGGTPHAAGGAPNPNHQPNPNATPYQPNTLPAANVLPAAANSYYATRRRSGAGNTLVGGLVGYLAGRRHGRRKAEKRLIPVQQKLEQQVGRLEQDITAKEQQLVASKAQAHRAERVQTAAIAGIERQPANTLRPQRSEVSGKSVAERTQPGLRETRLGLQKPQPAERLGHMAIATEAPRVVERTKYKQPNNIRQAFRPEAVKTMHRNELLELSEKITVEGASLRRVYESHLIGEKQLRHLVSEYLDGKDIRRELRRQMVEREIDFERDPQLRDRVRSHMGQGEPGGGLNKLLQAVGAAPEQAGLSKQEQRQLDKQAANAQRTKRSRQLADSAMATVIVVLAIVIVVLLMRQ